MKQLKDFNPDWYKSLEEICPQAFTYINGFEQSITNYRNWIIKQNKDIEDLRLENDELKLELDDAKGSLIHIESYLLETATDGDPF